MPKEIFITKPCKYLDTYTHHTPDELIKFANRMKEDGVTSFKIIESYGSPKIEYFRMETEQEESDRLKKEVLENEQRLKSRLAYMKREAEALGFNLEPRATGDHL